MRRKYEKLEALPPSPEESFVVETHGPSAATPSCFDQGNRNRS